MQTQRHITSETPRAAVDWRAVRADFEATRNIAYLKTAATGLPVPTIGETIAEFYRALNAGGDAAWESWAQGRERARLNLAKFINCELDEVAFAPNTSFGMNLIIDALEDAGEVVSSELEFPTSTITWLHRGVGVEMLKPREGTITPAQIEDAITPKTGVLCFSHVQFSNGLRADLATIGNLKKHCALVVNASQSAGVFEIDVKRMKIDAMCATGHKWMLAGFGTGFVYMSRELQARRRPRAIGWMSTENPFAFRNNRSYVLLEGMAARAETGTPALPAMLATGASVEYLMNLGVKNIEARALDLNRYLTARLGEHHRTILSPLNDETMRSAETLVAMDNPPRAVELLAKREVQVSVKSEGIRIATHFYNDESDVDKLVEALDEIDAE